MDDGLRGEFILSEKKPAEGIAKTESGAIPTLRDHVKKPIHFYSSFQQNPAGISFAEQEENEEILLLLRRHFVTNIPWAVAAFFLALLPLSFPFLVTNFPIPLPGGEILTYYTIFYYLILFGFVLINFSLWYFHTGLVTSIRLVDIDLAGILYRHIAETKNKNIEDVSYTQIGFVRSLFNYGDVLVQTAGAENNIEYDRVPRPSIVADVIGDLQES